jgi:hypothetical protein
VYELTATNAREWFDDFFDRVARTLAKQGLEVLFASDLTAVRWSTPSIGTWASLKFSVSTGQDPRRKARLSVV